MEVLEQQLASVSAPWTGTGASDLREDPEENVQLAVRPHRRRRKTVLILLSGTIKP